jgi:hypothetical protein
VGADMWVSEGVSEGVSGKEGSGGLMRESDGQKLRPVLGGRGGYRLDCV